MIVLKWFCYILVCFDVLSYIIDKAKLIENFAGLLGFITGIMARLYVLYNHAVCWLLV